MTPEAVSSFLAAHGLWLLGPAALIEGPVVTVAAGALVAQCTLPLAGVILITTVADLAGDLLLWPVGRRSARLVKHDADGSAGRIRCNQRALASQQREAPMRLSCLIPAYNEAARIGAVLDVVLDHPLIDEVIVIDDGSTDDTARVAGRPGVRLLHMAQNGGKTRALAAGISLATGRYLLFVDADLIGLRRDDLTRLIRPVIYRHANASISLRRNAPLPWRWIGLDYISGERVLPRTPLVDHLDCLSRLPRFGIEVFLNMLWIKADHSIAVVRWDTVESPTKFHKRGFFAGAYADAAMMFDIFQTVGVCMALRQIWRLRMQCRVH